MRVDRFHRNGEKGRAALSSELCSFDALALSRARVIFIDPFHTYDALAGSTTDMGIWLFFYIGRGDRVHGGWAPKLGK